MTTTAPPPRTPPRHKAGELAKHLRGERPDYAYLKQVFGRLRAELDVEVDRAPKKLPHVPTEQEIRAFYEAVWNARRATDLVMIKTLLYTGVRVSELVRIRTADVDLDTCRCSLLAAQIRCTVAEDTPARRAVVRHLQCVRLGPSFNRCGHALTVNGGDLRPRNSGVRDPVAGHQQSLTRTRQRAARKCALDGHGAGRAADSPASS